MILFYFSINHGFRIGDGHPLSGNRDNRNRRIRRKHGIFLIAGVIQPFHLLHIFCRVRLVVDGIMRRIIGKT